MNLSGINLRDFEYAIAVAELGSFVKAAERCHVTQPSLSIQIGKLEERLKTVLFERTTRRNIITPHGRELIGQMRKILHETTSLMAMAQTSDQAFGGALRLSAIATLGPYYFPHILQPLRKNYPGLTLILGEGRTGDLIASLNHGELDAVLIASSVADSAVSVLPLFQEPFFMACPDQHCGNERLRSSWEGIAAADRLLLEEGHCLREQAIAACADVGASNRHATSLETLKYMVAAGEGCTLIPALAVSDVAGVEYLPLTGARYVRTVSLIWRLSDPRSADFADLGKLLQALHPSAARWS
ncbi:LysR substrate-binding domain-containing protein [Duganella aquatilis]|nr:LysR substrate-binding domain-containing protein [Duganella aquatilis]